MGVSSVNIKCIIQFIVTAAVCYVSHCTSQAPPLSTEYYVSESSTPGIIPPVGSTEVTEAVTSINLASSTAIPAPTPTPFPVVPKPDTTPPYYCPCDYTLNSCDYNCCCDPDCSKNAKSVFSSCSDEESFQRYSSLSNSRRCFKNEFLFRNNTVYKSEVSKSGNLFCLVSDNLNKEEIFVPVENVNASKISSSSKPSYFWNSNKTEDKMAEVQSKHYKFGNKIQLAEIRRKGNVTQFFRTYMSLPSPAYATICSAMTPITFLQNIRSTCQTPITNLRLQCESTKNFNIGTFLKDAFVIKNPSLNLTQESLINFTYLGIRPSGWVKVEELLSPSYNRADSKCLNVLQDLELVFQHSGVQGIVHVMAHIRYANFSSSAATTVHQKFSVQFAWENREEENVHPHNARLSSGNPGYLFGKPVLMGSLVKTSTEDLILSNKTKEEKEAFGKLLERRKFIINMRTAGPMTLLSPHGCGGERKPLLFGYDMNVNCLLDYSNLTSCQSLQKNIGKLLLGDSPKNFTGRFVAAIGSPDFQTASHWVGLLTSEDPTGLEESGSKAIENGCEGLITALHIQIVYARVGSIHYPQLRIHGVLFQFGESTNIPRKAANGAVSQILLTTTAKFTDITPSPVTPLPKWPVVSIKLPADFFYPFSIATGGAYPTVAEIPAISIGIFYFTIIVM